MKKPVDTSTSDRYFELWKDFMKQGMMFGEALIAAQKVLIKKKQFKKKTAT